MDINVTQQDGISIVNLSGDIDLYNSPKVRETFNSLVDKKESRILVNLSNVNYMDSSALATLIEALQNTTKYSGKLVLTGLKDSVKNLFEIARLDNIFKIYTTKNEALKNL